MRRLLIVCLLLVAAGSSASAQEILRGKITKLDVAGGQITVNVEGKDREFKIGEETQVFDAQGANLAERMKGFQVGSAIFLKPTAAGDALEGIKLGGGGGGGDNPAAGQRPEGAARGGPSRAKLKSLDVEGKVAVLVDAAGKETKYEFADSLRVHNAPGATLAEQLKAFKDGDDILYVGERRGDKNVLTAIGVSGGGRGDGGAGRAPGVRVTPDTSNMKPLTDPSFGKYQGFDGGLYPDGKNERPAAHLAAGMKQIAEIQPRNAEGKPDPAGKVVLMSVGMSNTSQLSQGLEAALRQADGLHPQFQFLNGAQGGMTAEAIQNPDDGGRGAQYWRVVDERLQQAGVTRQQIQAVWIKQADAGPRQGFPDYARKLEGELQKIVQVIQARFPNVKVVYLSGRTYGGYATTGLNPEPYAFESGFSVKWLIERQIKGDAELNFDASQGTVRAPWLTWGPYVWANGETKNSEGLSYLASDFVADGTHHAPEGHRKVGQFMLEQFRKDATMQPWMLKK
jgi:hypothetical protein